MWRRHLKWKSLVSHVNSHYRHFRDKVARTNDISMDNGRWDASLRTRKLSSVYVLDVTESVVRFLPVTYFQEIFSSG